MFSVHHVPSWLQRMGNTLAPGLVWAVQNQPQDAESKAIYLTFDDGPVPGPTEFVLDALEQHQAKATFFAVGENVLRHPDIARKVVEAGHTLANHTHNHIKGWAHSTEEYLANVATCQAAIADVVGHAPLLFRPPYGRITPEQARALHADNYQLIMWTVLTADYDPSLTAGACLRGSYPHCAPGAIVVFHDSAKAAPRMEKALPALLHVLANEGYTFKAL
jgi:peptidoglycan/xylan/chitin deacetylase (PgdA/CDA1 family)